MEQSNRDYCAYSCTLQVMQTFNLKTISNNGIDYISQ